MEKRVGVFVDVSNLYHCVKNHLNGKLDYQKLLDLCKTFGELNPAIAYGAQFDRESERFKKMLQHVGFIPKYKTIKQYASSDGTVKRKADHDVTIAVDVMAILPMLDILILGSGDGDLVPLVQHAISKGVEVIIIACGVSNDLKETANKTIEITEELLAITNND